MIDRELGNAEFSARESEYPPAQMLFDDEAPGGEIEGRVPRNGNLDPGSDVRAVRTMSPQILCEHKGHVTSSISLLPNSDAMQHVHAYAPMQPMWK